MIDNNISSKIDTIKRNVEEINLLMAELHKLAVEVRIQYKDASGLSPPQIDLWRATEHVDYLRRES